MSDTSQDSVSSYSFDDDAGSETAASETAASEFNVDQVEESPVPPMSQEQAQKITDIVGSLGDENVSKTDKSKMMLELTNVVGTRAKQLGNSAIGRGRVLSELLLDAVPHIPIRDQATLVQHYDGLTGEALADALVSHAKRTTMTIGIAGGAVAAAEWAAMPMLLAIPLEVVVETIAVALVEVKLVAELHAVYGIEVPGGSTQRAMAFAGSWSSKRGVDPLRPWTIPSVLGIAGRQTLGRRMIARFARNLGTVIPFFVGAGLGAVVNRGETDKMARELRVDLRRLTEEEQALRQGH